METSPKIDRRVFAVTVESGGLAPVIHCESFFLDASRQQRVFEFRDNVAILNPFTAPMAASEFARDLRTHGTAMATHENPTIPAVEVIRLKMAEAFGPDAGVAIRELYVGHRGRM